MPRPYGVKQQKKRKREENDGKGEIEPLDEEEVSVPDVVTTNEVEKPAEDVLENLSGIPLALLGDKNKTGVIFILEKASLEVGKVGKTYQLLSSDEHSNFLRKHGKNPADYRPDIVHQALLTILDSPLNKAERVRAVYVRTDKGVLIEVKPYVRIPRTAKRFSGIMLQLLQKMSISAVGKREKLMRVIKNPVTQYLPPNSRKIGFSYSSERLVELQDYVSAIEDDTNFVFVVGAMAHGKIDETFADDNIAMSSYPLSAAWCLFDICKAMALKWKIL